MAGKSRIDALSAAVTPVNDVLRELSRTCAQTDKPCECSARNTCTCVLYPLGFLMQVRSPARCTTLLSKAQHLFPKTQPPNPDPPNLNPEPEQPKPQITQEYHRYLLANQKGKRKLIAAWLVHGGYMLDINLAFVARLFRVSAARVRKMLAQSRACNRRCDYALLGLTSHRMFPKSYTLHPEP